MQSTHDDEALRLAWLILRLVGLLLRQFACTIVILHALLQLSFHLFFHVKSTPEMYVVCSYLLSTFVSINTGHAILFLIDHFVFSKVEI